MSKPQPVDDAPIIITLDIETCPLDSAHWGLWEQNIGLDMIGTEWSILSFAYKYLGKRAVHYFSTAVGAERDDRPVLSHLWEVLDEADIVVTQNGKSFDIRKINARLVMAGFRPYSPVKVVDTKVTAKKHFAFTSNRLEWLGEHVAGEPKSKHRKFPGFELWREYMRGNPKARAEMEKYNKQDVRATEKVYLKLRPWMEGHPNVANFRESDKMLCPYCSSTKVQRRGYARTQVGLYHRIHCYACGGWSRTRFTLHPLSKRKALLSN